MQKVDRAVFKNFAQPPRRSASAGAAQARPCGTGCTSSANDLPEVRPSIVLGFTAEALKPIAQEMVQNRTSLSDLDGIMQAIFTEAAIKDLDGVFMWRSIQGGKRDVAANVPQRDALVAEDALDEEDGAAQKLTGPPSTHLQGVRLQVREPGHATEPHAVYFFDLLWSGKGALPSLKLPDFGGRAVMVFVDAGSGSGPERQARLLEQPSGSSVRVLLRIGVRVTFNPSAAEEKINAQRFQDVQAGDDGESRAIACAMVRTDREKQSMHYVWVQTNMRLDSTPATKASHWPGSLPAAEATTRLRPLRDSTPDTSTLEATLSPDGTTLQGTVWLGGDWPSCPSTASPASDEATGPAGPSQQLQLFGIGGVRGVADNTTYPGCVEFRDNLLEAMLRGEVGTAVAMIHHAPLSTLLCTQGPAESLRWFRALPSEAVSLSDEAEDAVGTIDAAVHGELIRTLTVRPSMLTAYIRAHPKVGKRDEDTDEES
jgi:hypothetical protein